MLILAGVAINLTVGDNGIFKKSQEGAQIYKNVASNEATSLNSINTEMENLINEVTATYKMIDGVPVPNGFTHTEGTKETGFIIKNDKDGNEFVWIPMDLVEYNIYDWNKGLDTALKFIETVGDDRDETYPIDSTNKGWYSNNNANNPDQETGKSVDTTGVTIPNMKKNIYDMAGNVKE